MANDTLRIRNREMIKRCPDLKHLRDILLGLGGEEVVLLNEPDLADILEYGFPIDGETVVHAPGEPCDCHSNSARLWESNPDVLILTTGYALSPDGLWRQHSWVFDQSAETVIETTELRDLYFGFPMSPKRAERFANENPS